jgi:peptidyl-prolyl cis-trans isomerase A (cyclophilin A)
MMRISHFLFIAALSAATPIAGTAAAARAQTAPERAGIVRVVIDTDLGVISVALDSLHAPRTVTNFLRYVDGGFYADGVFHRTVTPANQPRDSVRIEVIQGGANPQRANAGFPPIELERTNVTGLRHLDGTISMARGGPTTATSDFFLCIGDQPALDFAGHRNLDGQGFAAFGQVTSGMAVVREIQRSPAQAQQLTPPVRIRSIRRVPSR